jgi:hypothetical protein
MVTIDAVLDIPDEAHLKKTIDHHPTNTEYQKFNKKIALWMANNVGTMTCFWLVLLLCLCAIPSVLYSMNVITTKVVFTSYGFYLALTWLISTTFQAIMLPGLMVGQNLQNEAADTRNMQMFVDIGKIKSKLGIADESDVVELAGSEQPA